MAKRNSRNQKIDPHASDPRDRCYTPAYALDPLLPYLPSGVVFTPFAGVGSEVVSALELGRRGVGIELKQSYYRIAAQNLQAIEARPAQLDLFGEVAA